MPHIFPCSCDAAAFTAQWHAADTSHDRPCDMSSNAPLRTEIGLASLGPTDGGVEPLAKPVTWNS